MNVSFVFVSGLLNLRGSDKNMTPIFFSYVIITQNKLSLYLEGKHRYNKKIYNHFYKENVDIEVDSYENTVNAVYQMVERKKNTYICRSKLLNK